MNGNENWQRVKAIVGDALELPEDERAAFVQAACADDRALRDEVESLVFRDLDDGFLEQPLLVAAGHAPSETSKPMLETGSRLGPYEIGDLIGAGGMGQVYRARDTRLDRLVAIKVLPGQLAFDDATRQRFEREARVISGLNHPHICTLYDIGTEEGIGYLVMEFIEGATLAATLEDGPLSVPVAVSYARQLADGLQCAHDAGIVHRDIKPGNVMLGESGAKLLDFGLAKRSRGPVVPSLSEADAAAGLPQLSDEVAASRMTRFGTVMGTAPYMSPEQARGEPVDAIADQFSLGATLYEMLTRQRPFRGATTDEVVESVLTDTPKPIRQVRPEVPADLEALVMRCLEKDPKQRFASTAELAEALGTLEQRYGGGVRLDRRAAITALVAVIAIAAFAAYRGFHDDVIRWMERDTLSEVDALTEAGDLAGAYSLLYPLAERLPEDPATRQRLNRITLPIVINTIPSAARVRFRPYGSNDAWIDVGETPLVGQRIPYAMMEWQIEKEGYATFTGAPFGVGSFTIFGRGFQLVPENEQPPGMVRIPGGIHQRPRFSPVQLEDYWLDRYEVSNREYAEFVSDGGYDEPLYWQQAFVEGGRELPFLEAMSRFVDRDGEHGPAGWQGGSFANEGADMPVTGVSWFEADAYCRYRDKSLPTLFHWAAANRQEQLSDIVRVSNFGDGPAPVGRRRGLSDFGAYDMAGNVREWVSNANAAGGRYLLGGAWSDRAYSFNVDSDSEDPWIRASTNGLRCARYPEPIDAALTRTLELDERRQMPPPISDELYEAYGRVFQYDDRPLDVRVLESRVEDKWRYEFVSFDAAYGGERVMAHLFLPNDAEPPYQAVIWFPGNDAFLFGADNPLASPYLFDFVPLGGRALVYPVYKGSYQRTMQIELPPAGRNQMRDMLAMWSKDLSRTLDFLAEREDIDSERIAYYGFSAGAVYGPIFTAIEDRFSASVLLGGGMLDIFPPDTSLAAFAPRSTLPTVMINGVDDFIMPYDAAQRTFFELLGSPPNDKRHARLDGGHIPSNRRELINEVEGWLDRHMGAVE